MTNLPEEQVDINSLNLIIKEEVAEPIDMDTEELEQLCLDIKEEIDTFPNYNVTAYDEKYTEGIDISNYYDHELLPVKEEPNEPSTIEAESDKSINDISSKAVVEDDMVPPVYSKSKSSSKADSKSLVRNQKIKRLAAGNDEKKISRYQYCELKRLQIDMVMGGRTRTKANNSDEKKPSLSSAAKQSTSSRNYSEYQATSNHFDQMEYHHKFGVRSKSLKKSSSSPRSNRNSSSNLKLNPVLTYVNKPKGSVEESLLRDSTISCSRCSFTTDKKKTMLNHEYNHKVTKSRIYNCVLCSQKYTKHYLALHMASVHPSQRYEILDEDVKYKCLECSFSTCSKSYLGRHIKSHKTCPTMECLYCEHKSTLADLSFHMNICKKKNTILKSSEKISEEHIESINDIHKLNCESQNRVQVKEASKTNNKQNTEGLFKCIQCPFEIDLLADFLDHQLTHQPNNEKKKENKLKYAPKYPRKYRPKPIKDPESHQCIDVRRSERAKEASETNNMITQQNDEFMFKCKHCPFEIDLLTEFLVHQMTHQPNNKKKIENNLKSCLDSLGSKLGYNMKKRECTKCNFCDFKSTPRKVILHKRKHFKKLKTQIESTEEKNCAIKCQSCVFERDVLLNWESHQCIDYPRSEQLQNETEKKIKPPDEFNVKGIHLIDHNYSRPPLDWVEETTVNKPIESSNCRQQAINFTEEPSNGEDAIYPSLKAHKETQPTQESGCCENEYKGKFSPVTDIKKEQPHTMEHFKGETSQKPVILPYASSQLQGVPPEERPIEFSNCRQQTIHFTEGPSNNKETIMCPSLKARKENQPIQESACCDYISTTTEHEKLHETNDENEYKGKSSCVTDIKKEQPHTIEHFIEKTSQNVTVILPYAFSQLQDVPPEERPIESSNCRQQTINFTEEPSNNEDTMYPSLKARKENQLTQESDCSDYISTTTEHEKLHKTNDKNEYKGKSSPSISDNHEVEYKARHKRTKVPKSVDRSSLKCDKCSFSTTLRHSMARHQLAHQKHQPVKKCIYCPFRTTPRCLKDHMRRSHADMNKSNQKPNFSIQAQELTYLGTEAPRQKTGLHSNSAPQIGKSQVRENQKQFKKSSPSRQITQMGKISNIKKSINNVPDVKNKVKFYCPLCPYSTTLRIKLKKHNNQKHRNSVETQTDLHASLNKQNASSKKIVIEAELSDTAAGFDKFCDEEVKCKLCSGTFAKCRLDIHYVTHKTQKSMKCVECDFVSTPRCLMSHMKVRHQLGPESFKFCSVAVYNSHRNNRKDSSPTFAIKKVSSSSIKPHLVSSKIDKSIASKPAHSSVKLTTECTFCSWKTSGKKWKAALRKHVNAHFSYNQPIFGCQYCNTKGSKDQIIRFHNDCIMPGKSRILPPLQVSLNCQNCSFTTYFPAELAKHMEADCQYHIDTKIIGMCGKARNRGIRSKWSREDLENAVTAVQEGRMSRQGASKTFSIPRRTLSRYVDSNQTSKAAMGRKPILTGDQEKELSARIIRLAEVGYPLTSRTLRRCVFNFCTENAIQNKFSTMTRMAGRYWLNGFMERNPAIRQRKAQSMNPARAQKLNRFIVNDYFSKLREVLLELDLMDSPEKIFNVDEKGCRLSLHHQQSVLAKKGAKRVHLVAPEHGENVTIVSCANACGNSIPPTILFKGKRLKPEWKDTLPPGSLVLITPKGSMNITTFCTWIEHLAKYKPPGKCLLIFDGAKCHLDHTIVDVAERYNVVLFCLPSNTTHELQPMDKSVFRSFEYHWDDQVLQYWTKYKDRNITKQRFGEIFSVVWDKSVTPANIKAGFAATGIFPFKPEAIPELAFAPSEITQSREEPIVDPTRAASPKAGPSNVRKRARCPSSSSDDDSSEENPPLFMDTSDSSDDLCPPKELNKSITEMLETPQKIVNSVNKC